MVLLGTGTIFRPTRAWGLPIHIQIEPTNFCNLDCITCPRSQMIKNPENMSFDTFKKIVDEVSPSKITLSGLGEPLINPQLFDMVRYSERSGIPVNVTTNGTLIGKHINEIIESGLGLLSISIDAANKETYERIRKSLSFQKIIDSIKELIALREGQKRKHLYVRTHFVIQKENFSQIEEFINLNYNIGVDAVYFQPLNLSVMKDRKDFLIGQIGFEEVHKRLKAAKTLGKRLGIPTNLEELVSDFRLYWKKYSFQKIKERKCILPWFSTYIKVDGSLCPCCAFAMTDISLGNCLDKGFSTIWNNGQFKKIRGELRQNIRSYKICKNCVPQTLLEILWSKAKYTPGFMKLFGGD
ncbi:MAG: radical SAM protein [bacterium]|nr:radical SAM protein [bacterium]